jgi:hypothetical protein
MINEHCVAYSRSRSRSKDIKANEYGLSTYVKHSLLLNKEAPELEAKSWVQLRPAHGRGQQADS